MDILILLYFSDEIMPYKVIMADSFKTFHSETEDIEEGLLQYTIKNETFYTKEWDHFKVIDLTDIEEQSKVIELLQKFNDINGVTG